MKQYTDLLCASALFGRISPSHLEDVLACLDGRMSHFSKGAPLLLCGDTVSQIGVMLSGGAQVVQEDFLGNQSVMTRLSPGDLFAETFVCANIEISPVSVIATSDCTALFLNYHKMITMCSKTCAFHQTLVENMVLILAMKNLRLTQKINILSQKTIREKLLAYFHVKRRQARSNQFKISCSRQELADYLCVDRSAMSRELSKMKQEQLLTFHQNNFELYDCDVN